MKKMFELQVGKYLFFFLEYIIYSKLSEYQQQKKSCFQKSLPVTSFLAKYLANISKTIDELGS